MRHNAGCVVLNQHPEDEEKPIRTLPKSVKSVFHVHGVDRHDKVRWQGNYSRQKWLDALCKRVPIGAEIGLEACASSHQWARELQRRGYRVKLVAAQ